MQPKASCVRCVVVSGCVWRLAGVLGSVRKAVSVRCVRWGGVLRPAARGWDAKVSAGLAGSSGGS
eukprot:11924816-Alexandrium_andersonii.AAC.1